MSTFYQPSIVTDKLAFYMDAGNPNTRTETTIKDLISGKTANIPDPSGRTSTEQAINFGGNDVDHELRFNGIPMNTTSGQGNTVELWCKSDGIDATDGNMPFVFLGLSYDIWLRNNGIGINNGDGLVYGNADTQPILENMTHIVFYFPFDWASDKDSARMWINSVEKPMTVLRGSFVDRTVSSTQNIAIGGGYVNGENTYTWFGDIAVCKVYNKELSDSEVKQNFNALRGRFGL